MSNAYLSPVFQDCQVNDDNTFLAGGLIWFYEAGTTTPILAYTTINADVAWSNPIQLNARGETGGEIWLLAGSSYKIILESKPEYGQTHGVVITEFDNVSGVNDPSASSTTSANWIDFAGTPTYISATSFSVTGDYRTTFLTSRRVQIQNSDSSKTFGTVVSSTYATGITTIVISPDYGNAVSSLIASLSYGFIETGAVSSIPVAVQAGSSAGGSEYELWINYDGTNLKWSKDTDASSATWPINAETATNASSRQFYTATAAVGLEADLVAKMSGVNDALLFNNGTSWGLYSVDGGFGLKYDRGTSKFSFGGFTLPSPATSKYIELPNGLIIQFGQGTASNGGTAVTFATAFPSFCVSVVATQVGSTHVTISANALTTTGFTAYAASTEPCSYIAFGY